MKIECRRNNLHFADHFSLLGFANEYESIHADHEEARKLVLVDFVKESFRS